MSDDRTAQECYNLCVKHGAKEAFRIEHLRGRSEAFASSAACSATCVTPDPEVTYNHGSLGEAYNRGRADAIREVRERVVADLQWMAEDGYYVDELHRIIRLLKEFK